MDGETEQRSTKEQNDRKYKVLTPYPYFGFSKEHKTSIRILVDDWRRMSTMLGQGPRSCILFAEFTYVDYRDLTVVICDGLTTSTSHDVLEVGSLHLRIDVIEELIREVHQEEAMYKLQLKQARYNDLNDTNHNFVMQKIVEEVQDFPYVVQNFENDMQNFSSMMQNFDEVE
ncbi:hypothetical protein PIB30_074949 [Stylosanthes scabra]|uniref:Uncharacterized protein n=1 Tax=Stylosanthes scabra TaxID=79078 RepID=A0ABU6YP82_9FABA|nr:hypothetical protein [Stylosanthes scabra]